MVGLVAFKLCVQVGLVAVKLIVLVGLLAGNLFVLGGLVAVKLFEDAKVVQQVLSLSMRAVITEVSAN